MTFGGLLLRNLLYHWRGNLSVLMGIVIGTAVLTGALFVGDSLRGSLEARTIEQLGWVEQALVNNRFFREKLADELPAPRIAPVVLLQGNAQAGPQGSMRRANKVTILGVDSRYLGGMPVPNADQKEPTDEVNLNSELARILNVKEGDKITLNVHKSDAIPRETLLGKRSPEEVVEPLLLTVKKILPAAGTMANFSLKPTPEPVRNAFVPIKYLQQRLSLGQRINALLAAGDATLLGPSLRTHLTLEDWNLRLRSPEDRAGAFFNYLDPRGKGALTRVRWQGRVPLDLAQAAEKNGGLLTVEHFVEFYRRHRAYTSLESAQMFLEPAVVGAAEDMVRALNRSAGKEVCQVEPILVYLADKIADERAEIPYAVVAAASPSVFAPHILADDEILLVDWPGSPLKAKTGDKITVEYYRPDVQGRLHLSRESFTVKGTLPLTGSRDDPDLTPEFPGITDKLDMASWENPPFPYSAKRVKPRDEEYWKRYRATPKAYVNLATGQKLWGNRFGRLTSMRFISKNSPLAPTLEKSLLAHLKPAEGGFLFENVKQRNLASSAGATDFSVLFLAFSFFLIVAALLLIGLLFRLNLDRRAREIGLLLAVGMRRKTVRRLLLAEGLMLGTVGAACGLAGAAIYASLMLDLLRARWPGGQNLDFLTVHVEAKSFFVGYFAALAVSLLTIVWATRLLARVVPRNLLAGQTSDDGLPFRGARWSRLLSIACFVAAVGCLFLGALTENHELKAGSFFGSGALLLTAGLAGAWWAMRSTRKALVTHGAGAVTRLGARNAGRHMARSLLTAGLLASATFLVVAVEVFHKDVTPETLGFKGGSGGFSFFAESDVPIFENLNDAKIWKDLHPNDRDWLERFYFYPFRVRAGDDASCLNLYQPLKPRILGVPDSLIEGGGFAITAIADARGPEAENPWLLLKRKGRAAVPCFVDANSAQWILKVRLGETFETDSELGQKVKLQVVGLLHQSIFQSEVLIADEHFVQVFPREEGFRFFLFETSQGTRRNRLRAWPGTVRTRNIEQTLESALARYGFSAGLTNERIAAYLAVENTYLSVFQALGGLGLVLGALGLGVVLVRSVWERRGELALLRALGFRQRALGWLVLAENVFLLALGLAIGAASALVAVAPHLLGSGAEVPWQRLVILLVAVVGVGLGACAVAVGVTLRTPLLTALRRE